MVVHRTGMKSDLRRAIYKVICEFGGYDVRREAWREGFFIGAFEAVVVWILLGEAADGQCIGLLLINAEVLVSFLSCFFCGFFDWDVE